MIETHETEADFATWVYDAAVLYGWRVSHFRSGRTVTGWRTAVAFDGKGFPDLVLARDRVVFAELKSARGRLDADQEAWIDALILAGAETYVWRPADREQILATLIRRHP